MMNVNRNLKYGLFIHMGLLHVPVSKL